MGDALKGRVALVTGATRGIGKAIARRLASEGAAVAIVGRTREPTADSKGSLEETVGLLKERGADSFAICHDLADRTTDRAVLVDQVERALGPVDILVNNAAAGGYQLLNEWSDNQVRKAIEVNFWAPWQLCRRVVPGMQERRRGWIVNISSAAAKEPSGPPFPSTIVSNRGTIYGGTKAMLNRWTISLAAELYDSGIAVNSLAPQGAVLTETMLIRRPKMSRANLEPVETMAEAALALSNVDPTTMTGQILFSIDFLLDQGITVHDLDGRQILDQWSGTNLQAFRDAQQAFRAANGGGGVPNESDRVGVDLVALPQDSAGRE